MSVNSDYCKTIVLRDLKFKSRRETSCASNVMVGSFKEFISIKKCMSVFIICGLLAMTLRLIYLGK
jgi:hypothetical protein